MPEAVEVFKALADETRLRILKLLLGVGEGVCVCELVEALGLPQYRVSRHLGVLRKAGLVVSQRKGTWVYYSPAKSPPPPIAGVFALVRGLDLEGAEEDLRRLRERLKLRVDGVCVIGYGR